MQKTGHFSLIRMLASVFPHRSSFYHWQHCLWQQRTMNACFLAQVPLLDQSRNQLLWKQVKGFNWHLLPGRHPPQTRPGLNENWRHRTLHRRVFASEPINVQFENHRKCHRSHCWIRDEGKRQTLEELTNLSGSFLSPTPNSEKDPNPPSEQHSF